MSETIVVKIFGVSSLHIDPVPHRDIFGTCDASISKICPYSGDDFVFVLQPFGVAATNIENRLVKLFCAKTAPQTVALSQAG